MWKNKAESCQKELDELYEMIDNNEHEEKTESESEDQNEVSEDRDEDEDNEISVDEDEVDTDVIIGPAGEASTTRYWDCSGGACGCGYGDPGNPTHCNANALFDAPSGNPYGAKFYGTAAVSSALGGDYWLSSSCGKCWALTG